MKKEIHVQVIVYVYCKTLVSIMTYRCMWKRKDYTRNHYCRLASSLKMADIDVSIGVSATA